MKTGDIGRGQRLPLYIAAILALPGAPAAWAQASPTQVTFNFPSVTGTYTSVQAMFSGTGTITPFGAATLSGTETFSATYATLTITFTLSNGDAFSTSVIPTSCTVSGPVSGGTGQFANATGMLTLTPNPCGGDGICTLTSCKFAVTGSGTITTVSAGPNRLTVAPSALSFSMQQGAAAPDPQSVSVFSTSVAQFTASSSGGAWLTVSSAGGKTPAAINVSINPPPGPGTYSGSITVTGTNTTPASVTVGVTLVVAAPSPPQLSLSQPFVNLSSVAKGSSLQQALAVSNDGSGALNFTAQTTGPAPWLSLQTTSGTAAPGAPAAVSFTADPAGLSPGTYTSGISVSAGGRSQTVPVTIGVADVSQVILLTQNGLQFSGVVQGPAPPSQDFAVLNAGIGPMAWSVAVSTFGGGTGWLRATPSSGSSQAGSATLRLVTVSVNPAMLVCNGGPCPAGQYSGNVAVIAPGAANSPQVVTVQLNLLPSGTTPPPLATPSGAVLTGTAGGPNPGAQVIALSNSGMAAVTFASTASTLDGQNWLAVSPASGNVAAGSDVQISVQANTAGLAPGVRKGTVRVGFSDGTVRELTVSLVVVSGSTTARARSSQALPEATSSCAGSLVLTPLGSVTPNATVVALGAAKLRMKVADCSSGADVNTGSVLATFDNGDASMNLTPRQSGLWEADWIPSSRAAAVKVQAVALLGQGVALFSGSVSFSVNVAPNANALQARLSGLSNNASYQPTQGISPGSWTSVFGEQMADAQTIAGAVPYPQTLQNTQVLLGGQALPLYFVSPAQVNALIPRGLKSNTHQQLQVIRNGTTPSVPVDVQVVDVQPGIYTANQQGTGQGAVLIANSAIIAGPADATARPAMRGEYIQIYCTGLGAVSNPPADGALSPGGPLAETVSLPQVSIGGVAAPGVTFSGLAPGLVGLYQINVQVPQDAPAGDAIDLVVSVGAAVSNTVTIAVQ